jgi:hypothetical protein
MIVEPCCYQKEFAQVFAAAQERGHASYVTFSETTIQHLLSWLVNELPMAHIVIALPSPTAATMRFLGELMQKQYYNPITHQQQPLVSSLAVIAQRDDGMTEFRNDGMTEVSGVSKVSRVSGVQERVTLAKYPLGFRAILIGTDYGIKVDGGKAVQTAGRRFLIQGSLNQDIVQGMQMVTVTTDPDYTDMMGRVKPLIKLHRV